MVNKHRLLRFEDYGNFEYNHEFIEPTIISDIDDEDDEDEDFDEIENETDDLYGDGNIVE